MRQEALEPFRGPAALGRILDRAQRLKSDCAVEIEGVMLAAHGEACCAGRIAFIEDVEADRAGTTTNPQ
jgi:hypothetical protein